MSLFAIADLHLSGADDSKSMAVFDSRWEHARSKLERNWRALVGPKDHVVIPGDFSWAMTLEQAEEDFAFVDSLPGTKYIGKGNHDFWWTSAKKMNAFFDSRGFSSLRILYNNWFEADGAAVCGTRGWFSDPANQKTAGPADFGKLSAREDLRLIHSLSSVPSGFAGERIVFLHFPPVWNGFVSGSSLEILERFGVRRCYFGHIHGVYGPECAFVRGGIRFEMISADRLDFAPLPVILTPRPLKSPIALDNPHF
jgi:predicted phosphohydrolase